MKRSDACSGWVLRWALVLMFLMSTVVTFGEDCPDGSPSIDLHTGQDANGDGLDDHWTVRLPGYANAFPAPITPPLSSAWRGGLPDTGPFNAGFRYPVLGDGRWLGIFYDVGTYVYEISFTLDSCETPVLTGEWAADNTIEILLNGIPVGVTSNPDARPPLPWLRNVYGVDFPSADPTDGLLHPTCASPAYRCYNEEDEFREIHYFEVADPERFNLGSQNTLTVNVGNLGLYSGFLLTGGPGTSVPSGANVRCCRPERAPGAIPSFFADGFESGDTSAWTSRTP